MTAGSIRGIDSSTEAGARASIQEFLDYWKSLPRAPGELVPHLRTFLDHAHPKIQPSIALVDVIAPQMLAVRLFGTRREATFGSNITRANALDFYPAGVRALVFARCLTMASHPVGWMTKRVITSGRSSTVRFLSLSLPLAVDSGAPPCIANYGAAMDRQPDENFPARINSLTSGEWVDLGAGIPAESPEV